MISVIFCFVVIVVQLVVVFSLYVCVCNG